LTFVFDRTIFYLDNYLNNRKEGGWSMAFAETFKALSDSERRKILELLKAGPMSAGEIASNFDTTGATISYHLKILKKADLIFESKEKNYIYYQLNTSVLEEIMLWIAKLKEDDGNVSEG
jgi:hypothetical protein